MFPIIAQYHAALPNPDETSGMLERDQGLTDLLEGETNWVSVADFADTGGLTLEPGNLWELLPRQRGVAARDWQELNRQYAELRQDLASLRGRLIPRSIYFLLGVLAFLVAGCVATRMFFLTAGGDLSRAVLLAFFIAAGAAFVGYLVFEVRRINHAADLSAEWF